jgi:hypothetical protein
MRLIWENPDFPDRTSQNKPSKPKHGEIIMKLPLQFHPIVRTISTAITGRQGVTASDTSRWNCMFQGHNVAEVDIWWGHTAGDAAWACNNWHDGGPFGVGANCHGGCSASKI